LHKNRFGLLFAAFIGLFSSAMYGAPALCPSGSVSNTFGTLNLGSTAGICGNVTVNAGLVTTTAPFGAANGVDVETWTGASFSTAARGFQGSYASVVKFSHFWANFDSLVRFDYQANFDGDGIVFAILDGGVDVLALHSSNLDILAGPPLAAGSSLDSSYVSIKSTGYHDLAFGVAAGCFYSSCLSISIPLDPVGIFAGISLLDDGPPPPPVQTAPEPTTMALFATGSFALIAAKIREKTLG
jgi:hypothetical protein